MIVGPFIVAAATLGFSQLIGIDREPLRFVLIGEVVAVGIACFIPVNSAAAVAELPPPRLSVGGAVNNTFRQVGAVIGVALLVAILGSPTTPLELVDAHQSGWLMISILSLATAVIGLAQPAVQHRTLTAIPAPTTTVLLPPCTQSLAIEE